jgi:excisionase family DNA binding protein
MTIKEFSNRLGVIPDTVRRWERSGRIQPNRTKGGHRRYTEEHIRQVLGAREKRKIIYCRVSSDEQEVDMENQVVALELFALGRGLTTETITEVGDGMSLAHPKLLSLVHGIIAGEIEVLIVAHKDRLGRFGFELIENIANAYGCEIISVDSPRLSPRHEIIDDFISAIDAFSQRIEGLSVLKEVDF